MLLDSSVAPAEGEISAEVERMIAWSGEIELLNASWSLDSGRMAEFRLIEKPDDGPEHPFKEYQKRRNGKVGQRFGVSIVPDESTTPAYDGELMLAGWTNSHEGKSVKFWLDEEAERHPFAGYTRRSKTAPGSLFAAAFVVIDETGAVDRMQEEQAKEPKRRKLSAQAHLMITSTLFCNYLRERCAYTVTLRKKGRDWTPDSARGYVKWLIGVTSLSDIDWDTSAAERFHVLVRKPFARYNGQE